ncbi:MAG: SAF domain-containing protein [Candidatus Obscuribacterales bacterium]|nr:SAF domain-containing protein [Candidatus Obscuribacterales bacterium]
MRAKLLKQDIKCRLLFSSLAFFAFHSFSATSEAKSDLQTVVRLSRDVTAGTVATQSLLQEDKIERRLAPLNAVSGISECVGRAFKRNLPKGRVILIDDLDNP